MTTNQVAPPGFASPAHPARITLMLAIACGLIAANVYYAQPIAGSMSESVGMSTEAAGLVVTMTQLGYGLGLLLVVPLGDLYENRRLTLCILGFCAVALAVAAASTTAPALLGAAFAIGVGSVAVQVLVPYAAHLANEESRGAMVGNVMSGLMLGIMLSRPVSSVVSQWLSWHAVFWGSAATMVAVTVVLARLLPRRNPTGGINYASLLRSMTALARSNVVLRRRSLYHAALFAAFSAFWTTAPLLLTSRFHLSQNGIALFALAGVAGAIAAPIAGRLADRGYSRNATGVAMTCVGLAFVVAMVDRSDSAASLAVLVAAGVLLDLGVAAHFVLGQRAIFSLDAELRSRLNGLYMATFFVGGALGSGISAALFAKFGWAASCALGAVLAVAALVHFASDGRRTLDLKNDWKRNDK